MSSPPDVENQNDTSPGFPEPSHVPSSQPEARPLAPRQGEGHQFRGRRSGDPTGLGLFSFASTLLIWSLYNLQTRRVTHPNFIIGMAIFCGGLAMILAGMWAFARGDSFGGTLFVTYGAFWLSYASILIPGTGILTTYVLEGEFRSALGIYLVVWGLVTFPLFAVSLLRNIVFPIFLFFLMVTFWILSAGAFLASIGTIKAGGVFGCITACIAYVCGFSILWATEEKYKEDKENWSKWAPLGRAVT